MCSEEAVSGGNGRVLRLTTQVINKSEYFGSGSPRKSFWCPKSAVG